MEPSLEAGPKVVMVSRIGVISEHRSGAYVKYVSTGAQEITFRRPPERLFKAGLTCELFLVPRLPRRTNSIYFALPASCATQMPVNLCF